MGEATDRGWTSARSESSPAPRPLRPQTLTGLPPVTERAAAAGGCCQGVNEASERHHREGDPGTPGPPTSRAFQKEAGFQSQPCPFQAEVSGSHIFPVPQGGSVLGDEGPPRPAQEGHMQDCVGETEEVGEGQIPGGAKNTWGGERR